MRTPVTSDCGIWVGTLELAEDGPVVAASGPPPEDQAREDLPPEDQAREDLPPEDQAREDQAREDQRRARVLVRVHGAPIGHVEIPFRPAETLPRRARLATEQALPDAVREHYAADDAARSSRNGEWASQVSCPRHFPEPAGAGISVVVCTRDRPEVLRDCLSSMRRMTYEPLEILVVDNAPTSDATMLVAAELALDDARIRYTREPQPGLSRARNHGMAAAKFDLLAFTDDDIYVEPGWPAAIAAGFTADSLTACVTGPVASRSLDTASERYFDARYPWGDSYSPRRYDLGAHRDESPLYPFKAGIFGTGANFAVRRDVMERLGGFDVLLGAGGPGKGGEDLDAFARIVLAGHRISYVPSALVWHRHRATDDALAEQVYAYGHGLGAYIAKRVLTREMSLAVLARSLGQSVVLGARMRRASQASQAPQRGWRLAASEARGALAGALNHLVVSRSGRPASRRHPGGGS
jgi:GT2 family glycosyltransferase